MHAATRARDALAFTVEARAHATRTRRTRPIERPSSPRGSRLLVRRRDRRLRARGRREFLTLRREFRRRRRSGAQCGDVVLERSVPESSARPNAANAPAAATTPRRRCRRRATRRARTTTPRRTRTRRSRRGSGFGRVAAAALASAVTTETAAAPRRRAPTPHPPHRLHPRLRARPFPRLGGRCAAATRANPSASAHDRLRHRDASKRSLRRRDALVFIVVGGAGHPVASTTTRQRGRACAARASIASGYEPSPPRFRAYVLGRSFE